MLKKFRAIDFLLLAFMNSYKSADEFPCCSLGVWGLNMLSAFIGRRSLTCYNFSSCSELLWDKVMGLRLSSLSGSFSIISLLLLIMYYYKF